MTWGSLDFQYICVLEHENQLERFWSSSYEMKSGIFDCAYEEIAHITYNTHFSHMCAHACVSVYEKI